MRNKNLGNQNPNRPGYDIESQAVRDRNGGKWYLGPRKSYRVRWIIALVVVAACIVVAAVAVHFAQDVNIRQG